MPAGLRVVLILASCVTLGYMTHKIRNAQMKLIDGFSWLLMSIFFIVISIWPQLVYWMCDILRIQSPTNLVYLIVIFLLLMKLFLMSIKVSHLENRINNLAQEVAIRDERFLGMKSMDDETIEANENGQKSQNA